MIELTQKDREVIEKVALATGTSYDHVLQTLQKTNSLYPLTNIRQNAIQNQQCHTNDVQT